MEDLAAMDEYKDRVYFGFVQVKNETHELFKKYDVDREWIPTLKLFTYDENEELQIIPYERGQSEDPYFIRNWLDSQLGRIENKTHTDVLALTEDNINKEVYNRFNKKLTSIYYMTDNPYSWFILFYETENEED